MSNSLPLSLRSHQTRQAGGVYLRVLTSANGSVTRGTTPRALTVALILGRQIDPEASAQGCDIEVVDIAEEVARV